MDSFEKELKVLQETFPNIDINLLKCYLCNFEDKFICREYLGGCKRLGVCKNILKEIRRTITIMKHKEYGFDECDYQGIYNLLFGRKITKVTEDQLLLDNGLLLTIEPNRGCGGCGSGWYYLTELNNCDNAITNIEFVEDEDTQDKDDSTSYKIFVYAENEKIKLLQVDGDDGNGYYGTGYHINVKEITMSVDFARGDTYAT